jgi:hypothetical protein
VPTGIGLECEIPGVAALGRGEGVDLQPHSRRPTPGDARIAIYLGMSDVDTGTVAAVATGARVIKELTHQPLPERQAVPRDVDGRLFSLVGPLGRKQLECAARYASSLLSRLLDHPDWRAYSSQYWRSESTSISAWRRRGRGRRETLRTRVPRSEIDETAIGATTQTIAAVRRRARLAEPPPRIQIRSHEMHDESPCPG